MMLELLQFVFSSFWTWLGLALLVVAVVVVGLLGMALGYGARLVWGWVG